MLNLRIIFVVSLVLFLTFVNAEKFNDTKADGTIAEINVDDSSSTDVGTSRLRHHYLPFYGGSAIRKSFIFIT